MRNQNKKIRTFQRSSVDAIGLFRKQCKCIGGVCEPCMIRIDATSIAELSPSLCFAQRNAGARSAASQIQKLNDR